MRNELQSVLAAVRSMSLEQLPDFLGDLEVIRATAMLRLTMPAPPCTNDHDELLPVEVAAGRMGVSTDYLYRHSARFPFTRREGRKLLFSSQGIDAYIRQKRPR